MTDVTSPVAKLSAKLPKGNGFSRAVPELYDRRGDLVFFVGAMTIEETSLDKNDTEKVLASIARFELATGPTAADVKDLLTRCSAAATSVDGGQQLLFAPDPKHDDEERRNLIRDLLEWGSEQTPARDVVDITDRWNSWHGGFYDARLEAAPPRHLREFAIQIGAIPDDMVIAPDDSDTGKPAFVAADDTDQDDDTDSTDGGAS